MSPIRARVVAWPAPLTPPGDEGVYGVRISGLGPDDAAGVARAARQAGLWIRRHDGDPVLHGPASALAALRHSEVSAEISGVVARALQHFREGPRSLQAGGRTLHLQRPLIVGVLNATPDSFYDGGRYFSLDAAIARADDMVGEGADLIEVGGETARPGPVVDPEEELRRVVPLIEALAGRLPVPVSVDTHKPEVAKRAIGAGAILINDISGLADIRIAEVAAESGAALVVMHIQGRPKVRQVSPRYQSVVDEVYAFLEARTAGARAAGVPRDRLVVDPGLSFGKAPHHDIEVLRRLGEFRSLGYPLYLATSRKNYIRDLLALPVEELLEGTAGAVAYGLAQGAHLIRTHDVRFMARLARMMHIILHSGTRTGDEADRPQPAVEVNTRGER
jgi:dihydropteroate synthase